MDEMQQVFADLRVALRSPIEDIVVHPAFKGVEPCLRAQQKDALVVAPDRKFAVGESPVQVAFWPRPPEVHETIFGMCEDHGVPAILRRREKLALDRPPAPRPEAQERANAYGRCLRWGVLAFIDEYVTQLDAWRFDEDVFSSLFGDYEAAYQEDTYLSETIVPLRGLTVAENCIPLDEEVSLLRASPERMEDWGRDLPAPDMEVLCKDLNYHFESGVVLAIRTSQSHSVTKYKGKYKRKI